MMRLWRRRARGDRGATLVEFAVVSPLIFFMLGGMLDIGLTVLGRSVASGAAREGARVGIIHFENADIDLPVASPNNALIKAAVDAKLVGLVKPDTGNAPYVAVRCLDGGTKAAKACTRASVRIDYDLLEVTVKWRSISATGGTFTPSNLTDVARMVIVGDAGGGGGLAIGTSEIGFADTNPDPVVEANADTTVTLTVTRDNSVGFASASWATSDGSAEAPDDYAADSNLVTFLDGEDSKPVTITIRGDSAPESTEVFTVRLLGAVNGTIGAANPATVTIHDDDAADAAPVLTALRMFDLSGDGRVDRVTADFNEPLATYTAGTAPWTLANVPSNGTLTSVTVSGSTATLTITPGSGGAGAPNTAVGSFTVALAQNANGVRDAAGNRSSFGATAPLDRAAPILLTVADTNGATNGRADTGDTLTLTFSEAIAGGSIPLTTNVAMTGGTSGTLAMPGVIVTTALNAKSNKLYSNCTLSFNGSVVSSNAVSKTITVVLGEPGSGCTATAGESNPGIAFAPATSLNDGADIPNAAAALSPPFTTPNNFNLF